MIRQKDFPSERPKPFRAPLCFGPLPDKIFLPNHHLPTGGHIIPYSKLLTQKTANAENENT